LHFIFFFLSILLFFSFLFFGAIGLWTQGLMIPRHKYYHLSHAPSPFCSGYFWDRVLCLCLGQPGLQPYLYFCCNWDDMCVLSCPALLAEIS
jgi:hypothetical protein